MGVTGRDQVMLLLSRYLLSLASVYCQLGEGLGVELAW